MFQVHFERMFGASEVQCLPVEMLLPLVELTDERDCAEAFFRATQQTSGRW
jgi:hypothetical protein